jgi:phosphate butyryltransferase
MHFHFDQLKLLVKKTQLPTIAVVAANDAAVMQALKDASLHVSFKCVLIGDALVIKKLLVKYPLDAEVIHELDLIKMSSLAVELVRKQQADVIMKGLIDTKYLLKAVVDSTSGIKKATVLSHVALLQFPNKYSLIATDCAMNINPDLPTK